MSDRIRKFTEIISIIYKVIMLVSTEIHKVIGDKEIKNDNN